MIQSFLITGLVILPVLLLIMISHLRKVKRWQKETKNARCKASTANMIADAKLTIAILLGMWLIYFGTYLVAFTDLLEVWQRLSEEAKDIARAILIGIAILSFVIASMLLSVNIFQDIQEFFIFLKTKLSNVRENYRSKRRCKRIIKKLSKTPANYQKK